MKHPLKEGNHFTQNLGGVAEMFDNIRTNTQGISDVHAQTSNTLKKTVLPIFETLESEIKTKGKELKKGMGKGQKAVDKARKETNKNVELLGQHTAAYDAASHSSKPDPSHDPYLLQRNIHHHLSKQIAEENASRSDLLAVQDNFGQFEAHIIKTLQSGMGQFYTAVSGQADQQKHLYANMVETSQRVDPLYEWKSFLSRNNSVLIDPSAPPRTLATATFANQNHRSTQAMCQGSLERKSGLLKKFSSSLYVITPSKFLHEFDTDDDTAKEPHPEMSIYLPDATMGGINGSTFSIKGKDLSKKMNLGGAKEFEFRARTDADAQTWWSVIREVVTGQATSNSDLSNMAGRGGGAAGGMSEATGARQTSGSYGTTQQGIAGPSGAEYAGVPQEQGGGGYGGLGANPYTGGMGETR